MSYKDYIRASTSSANDEYLEQENTNDWENLSTKEKINSKYNNGYKDYDVSIRDVVNGINNSKNKLSGNNVWLKDPYGQLLSLPRYLQEYGGSGGDGNGGGGSSAKAYRVEMVSSQGNIIKDKDFTTVLKAIVYEDNVDITEYKDEKYFKWSRFSGATEKDQIADAEWNLKWAAGAKEIPITHEDVNRNAMFQVQFVTEKDLLIWEQAAYSAYMQKINNMQR